jgi:hypothetical protein
MILVSRLTRMALVLLLAQAFPRAFANSHSFYNGLPYYVIMVGINKGAGSSNWYPEPVAPGSYAQDSRRHGWVSTWCACGVEVWKAEGSEHKIKGRHLGEWLFSGPGIRPYGVLQPDQKTVQVCYGVEGAVEDYMCGNHNWGIDKWGIYWWGEQRGPATGGPNSPGAPTRYVNLRGAKVYIVPWGINRSLDPPNVPQHPWPKDGNLAPGEPLGGPEVWRQP